MKMNTRPLGFCVWNMIMQNYEMMFDDVCENYQCFVCFYRETTVCLAA